MKHVFEKTSGRLTLYFPNDVVSTNVDSFRKEVDALLDFDKAVSPDWKDIKLELTDARIVDSAGLNFMVTLVKRVKTRNGRVEAVISSEHIRRTLMFTRLDRQMKVVFN